MRMLGESRVARSAFLRFAVAVSLVAAVGCGRHRGLDEDADDRDQDAGEAGRTAGRGGRGGRGGSGGAGTGAAGAPASVRCGNKQCAPPANPLALLGLPASLACCADSSKNVCGIHATEDAACEPLASADMRCPGVNLGALAAFAGDAAAGLMTGCCTAQNQCGLDGALFGRGCVENAEAETLLGSIPFIGGLVAVPAARACNGSSTGGDEDAGL